jgi:VIT1/CCC1 family predicted Fe2+/Mn2+ transporter
MSADDVKRSLANLKLERDAIWLYDHLAEVEKDQERASVFKRIAANERRHADIWATRLTELGAAVPAPSSPRLRVRFIVFLAGMLGTTRVSELVRALEGDEEAAYAEQQTPETESIAADEREHAAMWDEITGNKRLARHNGVRRDLREAALHRGGRSGTLRAAVFGANDGLVSNLALIMGVAGAEADNHLIVLAGIAGLLAGAFSMAAGEYISMQSQREMFENQISIEREEMRVMPDVEEEELAQIYVNKGLSEPDAKKIAAGLMADPQKALDTKVREELGLDPTELGSAWGAAIYSFITFSVGAAIPLVPYLIWSGQTAFVGAIVVALLALFVVGALVSIVTGKNMIFSGVRQVLIGAAAAAVTYAVGSLIGTSVA